MDKRYSKISGNLKMKKNIFYAQSGGVTPVINATAAGLIDALVKNKSFFGKLLVGKNGIAGALNEELIDVSKENKSELKKLIHTPGAPGILSTESPINPKKSDKS